MSADKSPPVVGLALEVVPGATQSAPAECMGDTRELRAHASPGRGKTNDAVEKPIANKPGLPGSAVAAGRGSARRRLEIAGLEEIAIPPKPGKPGHE